MRRLTSGLNRKARHHLVAMNCATTIPVSYSRGVVIAGVSQELGWKTCRPFLIYHYQFTNHMLRLWYGKDTMTAVRVKMGTNGRLVVPADLRKEMGLVAGKTVILEIVKGELRVRPLEDVVQHAQDRLRKFLGNKPSLSQELLADRRTEASRE